MSSDPRRCVMHLDLDAFFAAVEQRDKPSLRGRPVVVGGLGARGVVSTASYEARVFGARSAMPMVEARRRCPAGTAFLTGRFEAYRATSRVVMEILRSRSPLVEQVSVDEAYVDLSAAADAPGWEAGGPEAWCAGLLEEIRGRTGGLTASVGVATSKMLAKLASEMDKPAGVTVVRPGQELDVLHPLDVRAVAGVGPATAARLRTFGVESVGDLARVSQADLVAIFGTAQGASLHRLARADDDRPVVVEREAKSISSEETFATDVTDRAALESELARLAEGLGSRLGSASLFARTITVKVRHHDFSTQTRSATLPFATGDRAVVLREGRHLLAGVDVSQGIRLLGLGVSGLTAHAQEELELQGRGIAYPELAPDLPDAGGAGADQAAAEVPAGLGPVPGEVVWSTGQDVVHAAHGPGWVWGSGRGRVTVRFEGPRTPPGPVRTFSTDDPELVAGPVPDWTGGSGAPSGAC